MKTKFFKKINIKLKLFIIDFLFIFLILKFKYNIYNIKVLLCTIGKEENKYIKEFVNHYRNLKIKKIHLYDNNDINGQNFKDILHEDIADNFVYIINYRGIKLPQMKAMLDCYEKNKKNFNWIAFYDIDEFLHIKNYSNINQFLSLPIFNKCQSIIINWKYYADNNKLYYEPKPLYQRFPKPFYFTKENKNYNKYLFSAAKTIVRGNLNIIWELFPHYLKNTINCRPNGEIIKDYFSPPQYSIAYISHYTTKSTEEYAEKLNKGDVNIKIDDNYIKSRIFDYYFFFNTKTKEKIKLLKEKLKFKLEFKLN